MFSLVESCHTKRAVSSLVGSCGSDTPSRHAPPASRARRCPTAPSRLANSAAAATRGWLRSSAAVLTTARLPSLVAAALLGPTGRRVSRPDTRWPVWARSRGRPPGRESYRFLADLPAQFSEGFSMLSTTTVSAGTLVDSKRRPHCCSSATYTSGAASSGGCSFGGNCASSAGLGENRIRQS
jgi:hypothetical protein